MRFFSLKNIANISIIAIMLSSCSVSEKHALQQPSYKKYIKGISTGNSVISWNSIEGKKMFNETKYKEPFFRLAHHFAAQQYPSTCGPATMRIILSAVYEDQQRNFPFDAEHSYRKKKNGIDADRFLFTERNVFSKADSKNLNTNYDVIARLKKKHNQFSGGMDLEDMQQVLLQYQDISVNMKIVTPKDLTKKDINSFRQAIKDATANNNKYIIVNYDLRAMYDINSGHFSIIAAYNSQKDMVLVMDVAFHYGPWFWIKLEELYKDMNSDMCQTCNRGYIVVEERQLNNVNNK